MCKTIKNTRWLCHATRACHPRSKHNPAHEMRPPPFVEMCDKVDAFTRACHGRHEVDGSRDEGSAFYKTLECPRHHRRRVGNLQEAWLVPFSSFLFFSFPRSSIYIARVGTLGHELQGLGGTREKMQG